MEPDLCEFESADQLGASRGSTETSSGQDIEQSDLFGGLDTNNDDVITPDEWQWSRRSFARQDQNGDGQLTRRELTNAELQGTGGGAVGTSGRAVVIEAARG